MATDVPTPLTSQQEITQTWLEGVLTHHHQGEVEILSFTIMSPASREGFLSEVCFIEVMYDIKNGNQESASLVVKFLPEDPEVLKFVMGGSLGRREVEFYKYSASEEFKVFCKNAGLPNPVPIAYWAGMNEDALTIVLHNLKPDGYKESVLADGNSLEQIKSTVKSIAVIHAVGVYTMKKQDGKHPLDIPFDTSILLEILQGGMDMQDKLFANTPWAKTISALRPHASDLVNVAYKYPFNKTLVHSDLWTGNVMFSSDDSSASIIDWQFGLIGYPSCDLISLLLISAEPSVYTNHLEEVLTCYWQSYEAALKSNGMPVEVTYQQLKESIEKLWIYGYMYVTASLPDLLGHNKINKERLQAIFTFLESRGTFKTFLDQQGQ